MKMLVVALVTVSTFPGVNLHHLDWLRRPVAHDQVMTWQIYAEPIKKEDRFGPFRYVGAEGEGVGCIDDVARAAILYARHAARTGDQAAAAHAREGFAFIERLAQPNGTYANFIFADGKPNLTGPTSKPGLNWWTARALWALGEGARAFRATDPAYADVLRGRAMRTVAALEQHLKRHDRTWVRAGKRGQQVQAPGWFVGNGADVTGVVVLGLAALQADQADPRLARLIARYGEAIALWAPGSGNLADAHLPSLVPHVWHAYGAHMLHALAEGGRQIHSRRLIDAARREADHFTPRLLQLGGPVAELRPKVVRYPQIAYGVEPQVLGLLALADATGEERYAAMAERFASWLTGNNPAHTPMYDPKTGRVWDGIDFKGASAASGAESTIEGLLVLEALASRRK